MRRIAKWQIPPMIYFSTFHGRCCRHSNCILWVMQAGIVHFDRKPAQHHLWTLLIYLPLSPDSETLMYSQQPPVISQPMRYLRRRYFSASG